MIEYSLASKIKTQYQKAFPYPHIVIDNFIEPHILKRAHEEVQNYQHWGFDASQGEMEVNKFNTPWNPDNIKDLERDAPVSRYILKYLYSQSVLNFLTELTGIEGLIPDDTFYGGGIHKINPGGQLAVHADYSYHRFTGWHRRINLLLYMNDGWEREWGGNLELWKPDMSECIADIEPYFNRAVIFNITNKALHGHPKPLSCPEGKSRYSFALYYFTKDRPEDEIELNMRDGDMTSVLWKESPKETVERLNSDDIFKF
jgi:Rps23 Pro-64 3,4-dihydroxylase Tpa1-like proline 4-hydroxylase